MSAILARSWPFSLSLAVRICLALATCTFFQPDEYFQSLEPAHHAVFRYGALTWEWTIRPPVRSFTYPALFVPVYWILGMTGLDSTQLLIVLPKIVQGAIAAFTDVYTYKLASRLYGSRYGNTALFLSLTSFFNVLSLTRTLSNSAETSLATVALYYWPAWTAEDCRSTDFRARFRCALCLAGLAVAIRPTSAIMWMWMFAITCYDSIRIRRSIWPLIIDTAIIGSFAVVLVISIDSLYYGQLTFTPFTFLQHNFFSANPVSNFYGQNAWHFYGTQAIPLLLNTALPFAAYTSWTVVTGQRNSASCRLLALIVWTTVVYSLAGHKEWRFLHPLLPEMLLLATKCLVDAHNRTAKKEDAQNRTASSLNYLPVVRRHLVLLLSSLPLSIYVLRFHGRARISAMYYLRSRSAEDLRSVGFLMPCHSTPWQSYLHREDLEDNIWALGCEPPVGLTSADIASYRDQADVFYDSPPVYLTDRFPASLDPAFPPSPAPTSPPGKPSVQNWRHAWPSHLAFFGALLEDPAVREILLQKGYSEVWSVSNGWEDDPRRRGGVKVWKWTGAERL